MRRRILSRTSNFHKGKSAAGRRTPTQELSLPGYYPSCEQDSRKRSRIQPAAMNPKGKDTRNPPPQAPRRRAVLPWLLPLGVSALAWAVLCLAFPPIDQNFPLNDDWAFARGTFDFYGGKGIHYQNWASMPQLGQWLWAWPFVLLLGASHFALRVSTIVLSWLGLIAFADLLRQEGCPERPAAFAAAVLALDPLFFLLQGSFMTDVPALSFSLAALALYGRAFQGRRPGLLAAAAGVAVLAAVTRQNTVAVPAAAAFLLWRRPELRRPAWLVAVGLPLVAAVVTHLWFQGRKDIIQPEFTLEGDRILLLPFLVVHTFGLAALPLLPLALRPASGKRFTVVLAVLLALAGAWAVNGADLPYGGMFPYSENLITPWGALSGVSGEHDSWQVLSAPVVDPLVWGDRPLLLGAGIRLALTVLGCAAGALWLVRAAGTWRQAATASPLFSFTALQVPLILLAPDLYDRYLLFLLPGGLALAVARGEAQAAAGRKAWTAGAVMLALSGLVSVGLMHDWLAWNSARWKLGERALAHKIHPWEIEGGFEWDGWFAPSPLPRSARSKPQGLTLPFNHRLLGSHIIGRYALSFSEIPGTVTVDSEPYRFWLLPGQRRFYLLRPAAPP
jgi:hypothetical protein